MAWFRDYEKHGEAARKASMNRTGIRAFAPTDISHRPEKIQRARELERMEQQARESSRYSSEVRPTQMNRFVRVKGE